MTILYDLAVGGGATAGLGSATSTRYGIQLNGATGLLVGKNIQTFSPSLRKTGTPSGNITCTIRNSSDTVVATFQETLDANTLPTSFAKQLFTLASPVTLANGDRIQVEYGGTATVTIDLYTTDQFDTSLTRRTRFQTTYSESSTADIAATITDGTFVTAVFTHKYNIQKLVTKAFTHIYHIRKLVTALFTHKYNLAKLVTATFTHLYHIRKLVTKTFTHIYDILAGLATVTAVFTHVYHIRGLTTTTFTHKYHIRKLVTKVFTHIYNLAKLVTATFTHIYHLRKLVSRTFTHIYNIRKLVNKTFTHIYNLAGRATRVFTHIYHIRKHATRIFTHRYHIRLLTGVRTFTHIYNIRKLVSRTFTHIYDVAAAFTQVLAVFTHKYHVRQHTTRTFTHKYHIRLLTGVRIFTHRYSIRIKTGIRTFTHRYRMFGLVAAKFKHVYNILKVGPYRKITTRSPEGDFTQREKVPGTSSHLRGLYNRNWGDIDEDGKIQR